jgi:hypothetical protein
LFAFRPTCVPPKQPAGPIDLPPTHLYAHAGRLLQSVEWSAKYTQQPPHEAGLFPPDEIELPLIQPEAVATETLIDANIAESNLFKLHAALRTLHEVERTLSIPFFSQELHLPLPGQFSPAFGFLAGKVLLFTQNTKQLLRQVAMLTVGLLNLVIEIAEHGASFKR